MSTWRYFNATVTAALGGEPTIGRHDPKAAEHNCQLLQPDGTWLESDYLSKRAALGQDVAWVYNPDDPNWRPDPIPRTGPRLWQYFTVVYGDDDQFVPTATVFARRDLGVDDLNCQTLDRHGQWHESTHREREQLLGGDGQSTDCTAQQMFDLILRAQAETPGGLFQRLPTEPLGN